MADYTKLRDDIKAAIRNNGRQEITGDGLQAILLEIVDNFPDVVAGAVYQRMSETKYDQEYKAGTLSDNMLYILTD